MLRSGLQRNEHYLSRSSSMAVGDRTRSTPPIPYVRSGTQGEEIDFSFFPYPRVMGEDPPMLLSKSTAPGGARYAGGRGEALPPQPTNISNHAAPLLIDNEDFSSYSREQLVERLRLERFEKLELKRLIAALRESGQGGSQQLSHRLEEMTKELVGLREQNYRLKNIANDELVMLQKVETKEVYGKKTKVQEELDAAKELREEYDKLLGVLHGKDSTIQMLESELQRPRTCQGHSHTHTVVDARSGDLLRENATLKSHIEQLRGESAIFRGESGRRRELERIVSSLNGELQAVKADKLLAEKRISDLSTELAALRGERRGSDQGKVLELMKEVGALQGEVRLHFAELERLRPFERQAATLSANVVHLESLVRTLEAAKSDQLAQLHTLHDQLERRNSEVTELQPLRARLDSLTSELTAVTVEKRALEQKKVPELQGRIEELQQRLAQLEARRSRSRENELHRQNIDQELQECAQRVRADAEHIKSLHQEIANLNGEMQRCLQKLSRMNDMEARNTALTSELTLLGQSLRRQEEQIVSLEQLKAQLEQATEELAQLRAERKSAGMQELEAARKREGELRAEGERLQGEVQALRAKSAKDDEIKHYLFERGKQIATFVSDFHRRNVETNLNVTMDNVLSYENTLGKLETIFREFLRAKGKNPDSINETLPPFDENESRINFAVKFGTALNQASAARISAGEQNGKKIFNPHLKPLKS